jgi:hypothetical protein
MYSCEKDDTNIIDPVLNFPTIDTVSVTPDLIDTSYINITLKARVTSIDPVGSVIAKIKTPQDSVLADVSLSFDGTFYSANYTKQLDCWLVGDYKVEFLAETNGGLKSNMVVGNFGILNPNSSKPVISLIYAPDSLQRPPVNVTVPVFLKVFVNDPDGICDIQKTYYNTYLPNGNPSSGNPFSMYDDGDVLPFHCDTIAYDGKYSALIGIPSTALLGDYTFKFTAMDRSGIVSDTLYKIIRVYE